MTAHRARLPVDIRRKIQRYVRYFVFFALTYVTLSEAFRNIYMFINQGDVMKYYGFV